ncbi:hypothetical protein [Chitinophaga rhizosphaerae]|uniref:hypothetical protein n=1 Tax=Chitinophaga rhizosphaerae TaxID=1864947 RepID=UPI000F803E04|nr:hypothetical protein [Chitinophaga rhizosphaerae]
MLLHHYNPGAEVVNGAAPGFIPAPGRQEHDDIDLFRRPLPQQSSNCDAGNISSTINKGSMKED